MQDNAIKNLETENRRPHYAPPAIERLRIQTARNVGGYRDAETHCTIHVHDKATEGEPCDWTNA